MARLLTIMVLLCIFGSASGQDNQHTVASELVGKWCYLNLSNGGVGVQTETCITLNDDGSYEFYVDGTGMAMGNSFFPGTHLQERDSGTWWSQGNMIYYRSTSHGDGSFQFQKVNQPQNESMAMIVVSGQPFVSASAHAPW